MRTCRCPGHGFQTWISASRATLDPTEIRRREASLRVRHLPRTREVSFRPTPKHTRHVRAFAQLDIFQLASIAPDLLPAEVSSLFSFGAGSAGCTVSAPLIEKFGEPVGQHRASLAKLTPISDNMSDHRSIS